MAFGEETVSVPKDVQPGKCPEIQISVLRYKYWMDNCAKCHYLGLNPYFIQLTDGTSPLA